ncbi:MAG: hypothetical protein JKY37_14255 [Nannocystaceae bacterium]|nr:hypothetical protein [Nannocystaceae bacterium]
MPAQFSSSEGSILLDEQHFPMILQRWEGAVTVDVVRGHFEHSIALLERARRENVAVSVVLDASDAARPTSIVRKFIADHADEIAAQWPELLRPTRVVIQSAPLRGVITALGWLSRGALQLASYPSRVSAIRAAIAHLESVGSATPEPFDPSTYEFPSPD